MDIRRSSFSGIPPLHHFKYQTFYFYSKSNFEMSDTYICIWYITKDLSIDSLSFNLWIFLDFYLVILLSLFVWIKAVIFKLNLWSPESFFHKIKHVYMIEEARKFMTKHIGLFYFQVIKHYENLIFFKQI
jgi:hypothetical protein